MAKGKRTSTAWNEDVLKCIKKNQLLSCAEIQEEVKKETGKEVPRSSINAVMKELGIGQELEFKCLVCGKKIIAPRATAGKGKKYCSEECRRKAGQILDSTVLTEEDIEVMKANEYLTFEQVCDKVCMETGHMLGVTTIRNAMRKLGLGEQVEKTCTVCGKQFLMPRGRVAAQMSVCSEKCKEERKRQIQQKYYNLHHEKANDPYIQRGYTMTDTQLEEKRKRGKKDPLATIERDRKEEGKYDSYGKYVAAHKYPVKVQMPEWLKAKILAEAGQK